MLPISNQVVIPERELYYRAVRAQGAGGQNVNKVASAIHLRFDIAASSLPAIYKERLLERSDQRISADGVVVIKAQRYRSQDKNKEDARGRLQALIREATRTREKRKPTRAPKAARRRQIDRKTRRGRVKTLRGRVDQD